MAIDDSAKLKNIWNSFKKYLYDNLFTTESIPIYYNTGIELHSPENDTKWIEVFLLTNTIGQYQTQDIRIVCATKNDSDSENLHDLRDTLLSYLTNPDSTNGFKTKMIPVYQISGQGSSRSAGSIVGYLTVIKLRQSGEDMANNQVRFMSIDLTLFYDSKI